MLPTLCRKYVSCTFQKMQYLNDKCRNFSYTFVAMCENPRNVQESFLHLQRKVSIQVGCAGKFPTLIAESFNIGGMCRKVSYTYSGKFQYRWDVQESFLHYLFRCVKIQEMCRKVSYTCSGKFQYRWDVQESFLHYLFRCVKIQEMCRKDSYTCSGKFQYRWDVQESFLHYLFRCVKIQEMCRKVSYTCSGKFQYRWDVQESFLHLQRTVSIQVGCVYRKRSYTCSGQFQRMCRKLYMQFI